MMGLCYNRPEGFGPHSTLSAPLPTTCFTDTILLPLPTIVLPILLLTTTFLSKHHLHHPKPPPQIHALPPRTLSYKTLSFIYYFFIIVNILMTLLEIIRLAVISFSPSLLPLVIIGLLAGGTLHATQGVRNRVYMWQAGNLFLWTGGMVFSVVKTVGLVYEGIEGRKEGKYPVVDQVTDTGVVAGVYAILIVAEWVLWGEGGRRKRGSRESLGCEGSDGREGFGEEFSQQIK